MWRYHTKKVPIVYLLMDLLQYLNCTVMQRSILQFCLFMTFHGQT